MKIILAGAVDITDRVINEPADSFVWSESEGIVFPSRDFILADSLGEYSPFISSGVFAGGNFRNETIEVYDDEDRVIYSGLIYSVSQKQSESQNLVIINSRDFLGVWLPYPVGLTETRELTTTAYAAKGNSVIQLSGSVSVGDVLSPNVLRVPTYGVIAISGSTVTLDRGLEQEISDAATVYVSASRIISIPQAIKECLQVPCDLYGRSDKIGDSFDSLHARDFSAGHLIWANLRLEQEIPVSEAIALLLKMGSYALTVNNEGQVDIVDLYSDEATDPVFTLTDAEIIEDEEIWDVSRLEWSFDCLYIDGPDIKNAHYDLQDGYSAETGSGFETGLGAAELDFWAAAKPFVPVTLKGGNLANYIALYASQTSAIAFGLKRLRHTSKARTQIKCAIKPYYHETSVPIALSPFKPYKLNLSLSESESFNEENVRVLSYENDQNGIYKNVTLELTGRP